MAASHPWNCRKARPTARLRVTLSNILPSARCENADAPVAPTGPSIPLAGYDASPHSHPSARGFLLCPLGLPSALPPLPRPPGAPPDTTTPWVEPAATRAPLV